VKANQTKKKKRRLSREAVRERKVREKTPVGASKRVHSEPKSISGGNRKKGNYHEPKEKREENEAIL